MNEETTLPKSPKAPARFHFGWIPDVFIHPRRMFTRLAEQARSTWLTPLLFLMVTALLLVFVQGNLEKQAALQGTVELPPDYQWYTPEQQAQYMQSIEARQGPVFLYLIPGITAVAGVWLGWLIVSGLLHLLLTLLGGRGDTGTALNVIAWASLPLGLRDLVRLIYLLATQKAINAVGFSGFVDGSQGNASLFLGSLLGLVDLYLIWYLLLTTLGAKIATRLSTGKAFAAASISILGVLILQALIKFGVSALSSLSVVRPFFF
jgi:hypothetical protein